MPYEKRPYPLIDEIRMHIMLWMSDDAWKKLPVIVKDSITTTMNEMKILDALNGQEQDDERLSQDDLIKREKRSFVAIYKQRYTSFCDFACKESLDGTTQFIIGNAVKRLLEEGTTSVEYLAWFFEEFLKDEWNKKAYAPPTYKTVTSSKIMDKFIFQNKEKFRVRKQDIQNIQTKNKVMELVTRYIDQHKDAELGKKALAYSKGEITLRKFCDIFLALLKQKKDEASLKELTAILSA